MKAKNALKKFKAMLNTLGLVMITGTIDDPLQERPSL